MSDVFTSFNDYTFQQTIFLPRVKIELVESPLFQSGVLARDPRLDAAAAQPGYGFVVPADNPLSAPDQMMGESTRVNTYGVTGTSLAGARTLRWTAWGYSDHSKAVTSADPLGVIVGDAATWTVNANITVILSMLAGLFATSGALRTTAHFQNIAAESTGAQSAATRFNAANLIVAKQAAFGMYANRLNILVVNSYIYAQMQLTNLVTNVQNVSVGESNVTFADWLGNKVIVTDELASRAGTTSGLVYRSYLLGMGSIAYGDGLNPAFKATESWRIPEQNQNKLIYRRGLAVAPYGCSFVGTPADVSAGPTNTEYATAANWLKVFPDRDIKIVAFDTN